MINGIIIFLVVILLLVSLKPSVTYDSLVTLPSRLEIEAQARAFDQSLVDPSLVRITKQGSLESDRLNQRRDCLRLESPSTLVQTCSGFSPVALGGPIQQTMLKTSSQWYLSRPDTKLVIVEPVGWLDLANPTQYWYSHLIGFEEFSNRMNLSVIEPVKYKEFEQQEPF